jgi:hypothetical protein
VLTGLDEGKLVTFCLNKTDGRELWRVAAQAEKIEGAHRIGSPATPTCCTDGERLIAYFGDDLQLDLRQPIWQLVDQIRRLRPGWPDDYGAHRGSAAVRSMGGARREGATMWSKPAKLRTNSASAPAASASQPLLAIGWPQQVWSSG